MFSAAVGGSLHTSHYEDPYEVKDSDIVTSSSSSSASAPPHASFAANDLSEERLQQIGAIFSMEIQQPNTEECFQAALAACQKEEWTLLERARHLLDRVCNEEGRPLLHELLVCGEISQAKELIKRKITLHAKDREGNSPIHHVVRRGDKHLIAEIWLHNGINSSNVLGQTPLHIAARIGNMQAVASLIANGASLNALASFEEGNVSLEGVAPIHLAVIFEHYSTLSKILKAKPNLELEIPQIGNIIHIAIYFNNTSILKDLLSKTVSKSNIQSLLKKPNVQGLTPLMLAAYLGNGEALILLKESEVHLDEKDRTGKTALHWAVEGRRRNTIDLLLSFGCNYSLEDQNGKSPRSLIENATDPESQSLVEYLKNVVQQGQLADTLPPVFTVTPPENLVFKGGGPKGIAYVGALQLLEKEAVMPNIRRCAGTSAGAITASLVAFHYDAQEIRKLLDETTLMDFLDHPLSNSKEKLSNLNINKSQAFSAFRTLVSNVHSATVNPMGMLKGAVKRVISTVWGTTGVCKGKYFREWIDKRIQEKTGIKFCTFGELKHLVHRDRTFRHLHVFTVDLETGKPIQISSEEKKWEEVIISDAVRASMSIPAVFKPHVLHFKKDGKRVKAEELGTHVDGGVIYNFPLDAFDKKKYLPTAPSGKEGEFFAFNRRTLGFSLISPPEKIPVETSKINTIGDLAKGLFSVYFNAEEIFQNRIFDNQFRTIPISNEGVGMLEFNLTPEKQELLIKSGFKATEKFWETQKSLATEKTTRFIHARLKPELSGFKLAEPCPHFVGREASLRRLNDLLLKKDGDLHTVLLYGTPGIGKTELATTFGNNQWDDFFLIWTIAAEEQDSMLQDYRTLARYLKIHFEAKDSLNLLISLVHQFLERHEEPKPYLLIFDDAEKLPKLPVRGNGSILITSQQNLLPHLPDHSIRLQALNGEKTIELFKKIVHESDSYLEQIAKLLGRYPLAITQAAHYISNNGMSSKTYFELLEENKATVLQNLSPAGPRYPQPLAAVWKITLERLEKSSPRALEWLQVLSFLRPNKIPKNWLNLFLQKFEKNPVQREFKMEEILKTLHDRTLIKYDVAKKQIGMYCFDHALIKGKVKLQPDLEAKITCSVLDLLHKVAEELDYANPTHDSDFASLKPHLLLLKQEEPTLDIVDLLEKLGLWDYRMGRLDEAQTLLKHVLSKREHLGAKPVALAETLSALGEVSISLGKPEEAIDFYEKALHIKEKKLGKENSNIPETKRKLKNAQEELKAQKEQNQSSKKFPIKKLKKKNHEI